jgi:hypothetical protein
MRKRILLPLLTVILTLVLVACKSRSATPTPTYANPDPLRTAARQTADARLEADRQKIPTDTPVTPTPTPDATQTAIVLQVTLTPAATLTPTGTPTLVGKDDSAFTFKETIPDGTSFSPGATFTKTWQFLNTGTTTWTTQYALVFVSGDRMKGAESVSVPIGVPPEQSIEISVDMVAPSDAGTYKGYWRLRNSAGQFFGEQVFVEIKVVVPGG